MPAAGCRLWTFLDRPARAMTDPSLMIARGRRVLATEAAAVGAFATLVLGIATRRLSWKGFTSGFSETTRTTAMIFVILLGATSIFIADRYYATKGAAGILDAIYWAVVTIASAR